MFLFKRQVNETGESFLSYGKLIRAIGSAGVSRMTIGDLENRYLLRSESQSDAVP